MPHSPAQARTAGSNDAGAKRLAPQNLSQGNSWRSEVRTLHLKCQGPRFNLGQGTKTPQTVRLGKKKNNLPQATKNEPTAAPPLACTEIPMN